MLKVTFDNKVAGRSGESSVYREKGRGGFRGRDRGRGLGFNKALVECFKCHKLGHFQYECPSWKKSANYAKLDEDEELLLMAHVELNNASREDVWFLDSGCSNHMCGKKNGLLLLMKTSDTQSNSVTIQDWQ